MFTLIFSSLEHKLINEYDHDKIQGENGDWIMEGMYVFCLSSLINLFVFEIPICNVML